MEEEVEGRKGQEIQGQTRKEVQEGQETRQEVQEGKEGKVQEEEGREIQEGSQKEEGRNEQKEGLWNEEDEKDDEKEEEVVSFSTTTKLLIKQKLVDNLQGFMVNNNNQQLKSISTLMTRTFLNGTTTHTKDDKYYTNSSCFPNTHNTHYCMDAPAIRNNYLVTTVTCSATRNRHMSFDQISNSEYCLVSGITTSGV